MKHIIIKKENFRQITADYIDVWITEKEMSGSEYICEKLEYYGFEKEKIKLSTNRYGKPEIENSDLKISFSNTLNLSVFAVSSISEVGIDAEYINENKQYKNARNAVFTDNERKKFKDNKTFYRLWTMKEALVKHQGTSIWFADGVDLSELLNNEEKSEGWHMADRTWIYSALYREKYYISAAVSDKPELIRFIID